MILHCRSQQRSEIPRRICASDAWSSLDASIILALALLDVVKFSISAFQGLKLRSVVCHGIFDSSFYDSHQ
jgi:hypothetical protein